jgi:hypothetical protein
MQSHLKLAVTFQLLTLTTHLKQATSHQHDYLTYHPDWLFSIAHPLQSSVCDQASC